MSDIPEQEPLNNNETDYYLAPKLIGAISLALSVIGNVESVAGLKVAAEITHQTAGYGAFGALVGFAAGYLFEHRQQ